MKKRTTLLSLLFLNILLFSCSNLINNSAQGSLSIVMPGNNGRYSTIDNAELPSTYNIKLTRNKEYPQEFTAQAGAVLTIDKLVSGEYEIIISGSTTYYYFEGKANTVVQPNKDATVTVKLTKFRRPLYIQSREVLPGTPVDGTINKPFTTIDKALTFTGPSHNVAFYLDGTFTDFTIPPEATDLKKLYLKQTPGGNPAVLEISSLPFENKSYDFKDILIKCSTITVDGSDQLSIGGSTRVEGTTSEPLIRLGTGKTITISSPLTSSFVSNIEVTPAPQAGMTVLTAGSGDVNLSVEKSRFKVKSQPGYINQFSINNNGKLIRNKDVYLKLKYTKPLTKYYFKIKENGQVIIDKAIYSAPETLIKKDSMTTYCFTVGQTYSVAIYENNNLIKEQEFTITETNEDNIHIEAPVQDKMNVQAAIAELNANPSENHELLVEINSNEDFTTLGTGIKDILTTSGTVKIDCIASSNVTTIPSSSFKDCTNLTKIKLPEGITTIEQNAFSGTTALTSIELPTQLTTIGNSAFANSGITELNVPDSVTSLSDVGITKLNIPCTLSITGNKTVTTLTVRKTTNTSIPADAYKDCTALSKITLNSEITRIGANTFNGTAITTLVIPDSVTTLNNDNLSGATKLVTLTTPCDLSFENNTNLTKVTVTAPSGRSSMPANAYKGCSSLSSIDLPTSGLTSIGAKAFDGTNITKLIIPDSVTSLNNDNLKGATKLTHLTTPCDFSFANNTNLKTVTVTAPSDRSSMPDNAFNGCSSLGSITLPTSGLTSIGANAFKGCSLLDFITLHDGLTSIGANAFDGTIITALVIPNSVTTLGDNLSGATKLTTLTTPGNLVYSSWNSSIKQEDGRDYYSECRGNTNLTTVTITTSSIADLAFAGCKNITNVNFNKSNTSIGKAAFKNCSLSNITSLSSNITSIGQQAFSNTGIKISELPSTLTSVDYWAFESCKQITSMTVNKSVTGYDIFKNAGITSATINCTKLPNGMFQECPLTQVTISEALTEIGPYCFYVKGGKSSTRPIPSPSNSILTNVRYTGGTAGSYSTWKYNSSTIKLFNTTTAENLSGWSQVLTMKNYNMDQFSTYSTSHSGETLSRTGYNLK